MVEVMKSEADIDKAEAKQKTEEPIKRVEKTVGYSFNELVKILEEIEDPKAKEAAQKYMESSSNYVDEMKRRAEIYEDLAGLGMAVEKASHDTLTLLNKMSLNLGDIKERLKKNQIDKNELVELISDLEDNTYFLYEQLQIIEPLFRFEKRNEKNVSIKQTIEKVFRYYRYETTNYNIETEIDCKKDIVLKMGVGLVLQIFINLLDNSVYWLHNKADKTERKVLIRIDAKKNEVIISDSGPGIDHKAADFVFMEFFTRKEGKMGRGLGLFIVKEILDAYDASIEVIREPNHKTLKGANFRIIFPELQQ